MAVIDADRDVSLIECMENSHMQSFGLGNSRAHQVILVASFSVSVTNW